MLVYSSPLPNFFQSVLSRGKETTKTMKDHITITLHHPNTKINFERGKKKTENKPATLSFFLAPTWCITSSYYEVVRIAISLCQKRSNNPSLSATSFCHAVRLRALNTVVKQTRQPTGNQEDFVKFLPNFKRFKANHEECILVNILVSAIICNYVNYYMIIVSAWKDWALLFQF